MHIKNAQLTGLLAILFMSLMAFNSLSIASARNKLDIRAVEGLYTHSNWLQPIQKELKQNQEKQMIQTLETDKEIPHANKNSANQNLNQTMLTENATKQGKNLSSIKLQATVTNYTYLYPFYCKNASLPFRCPNSSYCAASYFECPSLNPTKCTNMTIPHWCTYNSSCVTNITTDCCPYNNATINMWCATQQKCMNKTSGATQCCDWTSSTPIWCNATQSCVRSQLDCCQDLSQNITWLNATTVTVSGVATTVWVNITTNYKLQNCSNLTQGRSSEPKCAARVADCFVPVAVDCKSQILSQKYLAGNTSYVQCWDGSCRLNNSECPNQRACPYGFIMCPGINTCMKGSNYTLCPNVTFSKCYDNKTNTTGFMCALDSGLVCKSSPTLCPSLVTCSNSSLVVCPDGTCAQNPYQCQQPSVDYCNNMTSNLTVTLLQSMVMCPDGTCANNYSYCNVSRPPTCSPGYSLCQDGTCKINCTNISLTTLCNKTQIKCPNSGLCMASYDLCPISKQCPSNMPIVCWNSACAASLQDCPAYPSLTYCQNGTICFDGSCAIDSNSCPTPVSCPKNYTKCPDSRCAPNITECQPIDKCNKVLCMTGECVNKINECPSQVKCPAINITQKCENQQCVFNATTECANISQTLYNLRKTQGCRIICLDGSCAPSRNQCPSDLVCPIDAPIKCWDRTCQPTLSQCATPISINHTCDILNYPNAIFQCQDGSCRANARDCPTLPSCSVLDDTRPVQCFDKTCRKSLAQCPLFNGGCPYGGIQCSDGSCALTSSGCSSQMTCSSKFPIKCADGTCKASQLECNTVGSLSGLLCSPSQVMCNGQCYSDRSQCLLSNDYKLTCPANFPVLAPDQGCYTSIDFYSQQTASSCPFNYIRCNDNSCQKDFSLCPLKTCAGTILPYQCKNGMCASDSSQCDSDTVGCPFYQPFKCWNGTCVSASSQCTLQKSCNSTSQLCPDGSCQALNTQCLNIMGCPIATPYKCVDGTCIDPTYYSCSTAVNMVCNPRSKYPIKCPNGLCVSSISKCIKNYEHSTDASYCYNVTKSFNSSSTPMSLYLCGDGKCVSNSDQCVALNDCPSPLIRCNDGSCRLANCPITQVQCPSHKPYRCLSGMCVANLASDCLNQTNGCPFSLPYRCTGAGRCMADSTSCSTLVATLSSTQCMSGLSYCNITDTCYNAATDTCSVKCPLATAPYLCGTQCVQNATTCTSLICNSTTSFLCPDNTCVNNPSQCLTVNKCPLYKPFKCADLTCSVLPMSQDLTTVQTCPAVQICTSELPVRCADGSCQASSSECPLINNCTYTCPVDGRCVADLSYCNYCPLGASYRCLSTGKCVSDPSYCIFQTNTCPSQVPIKCFDGRCVSQYSQCLYANSTYNTSFFINSGVISTTTAPSCANLNSSVTNSQLFVCSDGSCRTSNNDCKIIQSCSDFGKPYRCPNSGLCAATLDDCNMLTAPKMSCSSDQTLCPDGICRDSKYTCPLYKGCPVTQPIQCSNGKCGATIADCAGTSQCPNISEPFRCGNFKCVANMQQCVPSYILYAPVQMQAHIRSLASYNFDIVFDPKNQTTITTLSVPSNSIKFSSSSISLSASKDISSAKPLKASDPSMFSIYQTLSISTLSDEFLRTTTVPIPSNYVSYINRILPLVDDELDYEFGVISPIVTLTVLGNTQDFNMPMIISTKLTMPYLFDPNNDICLGKLDQTEWTCSSRNPTIDSVQQVYSFNVPSPGTYAVIISPNPNQVSQSSYLSAYVTSIAECNWWCQKFKLIFALQIVILTIILALIILIWRIVAYVKASNYAKRDIEKYNRKQEKSQTRTKSQNPQSIVGAGIGASAQGSFYDNNNVNVNLNGTYDEDQQQSVLRRPSIMEEISMLKKKDRLQPSNNVASTIPSSWSQNASSAGGLQPNRNKKYVADNTYSHDNNETKAGVEESVAMSTVRKGRSRLESKQTDLVSSNNEERPRTNLNDTSSNNRRHKDRSSRSRTPVPNDSSISQPMGASKRHGANTSQIESAKEEEAPNTGERKRRRRPKAATGEDSEIFKSEITKPLMEGMNSQVESRDRSRHRSKNRDSSQINARGVSQEPASRDMTEEQRQERRERRKRREQAKAEAAGLVSQQEDYTLQQKNITGIGEAEDNSAQRRRKRREHANQTNSMQVDESNKNRESGSLINESPVKKQRDPNRVRSRPRQN